MAEEEHFCRIFVYRNELDKIDSGKKILVFGEKAMKRTEKP
jgi:hypothetical protein